MWINQVVCKQNSAAFIVDFPRASSQEAPSIKKKLEESLKHERVELTGEMLAERLHRAEEKRIKLFNRRAEAGQTTEQRLKAAGERRLINEREGNNKTHLVMQRVSREAQVAENRKQRHEQELLKLRSHNTRVEEVCREQAILRQTSCERMRLKLDAKLDEAVKRREDSIKERKQIARQSYERKLYFEEADGSQAKVTQSSPSKKE